MQVAGGGKDRRARRSVQGCAQGRSQRQLPACGVRRKDEMGLAACVGTCVLAQPLFAFGSQAVGPGVGRDP